MCPGKRVSRCSWSPGGRADHTDKKTERFRSSLWPIMPAALRRSVEIIHAYYSSGIGLTQEWVANRNSSQFELQSIVLLVYCPGLCKLPPPPPSLLPGPANLHCAMAHPLHASPMCMPARMIAWCIDGGSEGGNAFRKERFDRCL